MYEQVRDWMRAWPFRPICATRREYLMLSSAFPGWLPPLSHVYEMGIPSVRTLMERSASRLNIKLLYVDSPTDEIVTVHSLAACIIRTRHDGTPCEPLYRLAATPFLEQLVEWLDGGAEEDRGYSCGICGTPSHGRDFAHILASNILTVNLPMSVIISELCSVLRMPFYRFIRQAIGFAHGKSFSELNDFSRLVLSHRHYPDIMAYPGDQLYDDLLERDALAAGMHQWDYLRHALMLLAQHYAEQMRIAGGRPPDIESTPTLKEEQP